jgi:hypothetical protein
MEIITLSRIFILFYFEMEDQVADVFRVLIFHFWISRKNGWRNFYKYYTPYLGIAIWLHTFLLFKGYKYLYLQIPKYLQFFIFLQPFSKLIRQKWRRSGFDKPKYICKAHIYAKSTTGIEY